MVVRRILDFFRSGPDRPAFSTDAGEIRRLYERKRWSVFISITLGYGIFYVCRLSLSVVKQPLIDGGVMNAEELGQVGSALLFVYAFGRFTNGFLSDRANIRRFMSTALLVSAAINLVLGFFSAFWVFLALWGFNGLFQSAGSAPSVVALSHWFSNRERGTRYGIWSIAHALGEATTFVVTAAVVGALGWRWGFWASGLLGAGAALVMYRTLADRPQTYGLPSVADYRDDHIETTVRKDSLLALQLEVLRRPAMWVLGLAGASMYVTRYAINNWGILYLQEAKGYTLEGAGTVVGMVPLFGLAGAASCGIVSDRLFGSRRNMPTLLFGIVEIGFLVLFFNIPAGNTLLDVLCLSVLGYGLGGLVAFLGGLSAVDLCPKRATGAAMGFIGLFVYFGAAVQDWVSGSLIHAGRVETAAGVTHDFSSAITFWVGASIVSQVLCLFIWNAKARE